MAGYTKNLKLVKPDLNDPVSPVPFNENADILDERISILSGSMGNKWELIKTVNVANANYGFTTILSPDDKTKLITYDEILICIVDGEVVPNDNQWEICFWSYDYSNSQKDKVNFMGYIYDRGTYTYGYKKIPNMMYTFVNNRYDPNSNNKTYVYHSNSSEGSYSEICRFNSNDYLKIYSDGATFNCTAKIYGRAWALPGD